MRVVEVLIDAPDSSGTKIVTVYAKVEPHYAVYRTAERVMVHFADDADEDRAQRAALVAINPIRGQINGLIDGWRASAVQDKKDKAKLFDRRVADGLMVALQGDVVSAAEILKSTKDDLVAERTSWARFQYLIAASVMAVVAIIVCAAVTSDWFMRIYPFSETAVALWRAAGAGTVGAFFSIAIGIRSRTVLTDLHTRDNRADAILRVIIGAIASALLVALLSSGLVTVGIGGQQISGVSPSDWLRIIVIAFVAGFSERIVPDLLEKSTAVPTATTAVASVHEVAAAGVLGNAVKTAVQAATERTGEAPPPDDSDQKVDGCVADGDGDAAQTTDDIELPPSVGGVAEPAHNGPAHV